MRRSRSDTAETRDRILATASKMFLDRGMGAVGMRDIMAAEGLTQGGFYRHFESKEKLIAEANGAAGARLIAMLQRKVTGQTPAEGLRTIVALYLGQLKDETNTYLCPLSMLGAELSHCDTEIRDVAMDAHETFVTLIADRLTHLPRAGARAVAGGIVSTMVGAVTLSRIAPEKAAAEAILRDAQAMIEPHLAAADAESRTDAAVRRGSRTSRASKQSTG